MSKPKQTMKGVTCKNGYWYARIDSDLKYPLSHLLGMVLGMDFFDKKIGVMLLYNSLILQWYARLGSNQRLSAPEAE